MNRKAVLIGGGDKRPLTELGLAHVTTKSLVFGDVWLFQKKIQLKICFQNPFLTSGSGQTENMQICIFAYFQFHHFPKSKIDIESRFEMRMSIFLF